MKPLKLHARLDKAGATASFACAIHCALMPLIITLCPLIGLSFFASEKMEWMLLGFSAVLGISSLCFGYAKHKSRKALKFLATGLTLLVIGRLMDAHIIAQPHVDAYIIFLVIGGLFVSFSHVINHKLCHTCQACNHERQDQD